MINKRRKPKNHHDGDKLAVPHQHKNFYGHPNQSISAISISNFNQKYLPPGNFGIGQGEKDSSFIDGPNNNGASFISAINPGVEVLL